MIDTMHVPSLTWIENIAPPLPDGIILDIDLYMVMLQQHLDFLRAFCAQWHSTFLSAQMPPLLLLTTHPETCTKLQHEGYTVVMKPFKPSLLLSAIEATRARDPKAMKQEGNKPMEG